MDKVAIFIDGSNFYNALKRQYNRTQLKFDLLARALVNRSTNRKLLRIYYYNASYDQATRPKAYQRQQKFFNSLRRTPYLKLILGRLERRPISWLKGIPKEKKTKLAEILGDSFKEYTFTEKGVDVQLAIDMLSFAVEDLYDVAILISGDGDFAPAVEAVKRIGKHVELGRVEGAPCDRLRDVCDLEIVINSSVLNDCWI